MKIRKRLRLVFPVKNVGTYEAVREYARNHRISMAEAVWRLVRYGLQAEEHSGESRSVKHNGR